MADKEWAWRDSLRRLAAGEEIPAFRANEWSDPQSVREKLASRLLTSGLTPSVEDRDTRRDLALYTLVAAAGDAAVTRGEKAMGVLMEDLCLDVDWLEEIVYCCPMEHAELALPLLAHIYHAERKKMADSRSNRRLASAIAFEFARAGLGQEAARAAYLFYAAGGQKHWLNNCFAELSLWEMRVLAARCTDAEWSKAETLAWFQRNTRLPARGYVSLGRFLGERECCLFGEPVGSPAFLTLFQDANAGGAASMYEASGCSTEHDRAMYAATAACANGVPALVASGSGGAACLVNVNGTWELSAPLPEGAVCSWSVFGQETPDFVRLVAVLGQDREKYLASARLAHMAQFLYHAGNQPLAHTCFREALKVQPLNYAAWVGFLSCAAPEQEIAGARKHFEAFPAVADALSVLAAR